ncbi:gliding motility lipoprotein GldH [Roseivirga sp. BDSF3-8]|uniref:gliding motility lipoprotein GldH n=1 Tax=Roseivirga sp. BDSF3-8 TaxID=3241598 RepID=UPI003531C46A
MTNLKQILGVTVLALFLFTSCDENRVYETNYDLPDKLWREDSVLTYDFTIAEPGSYDFYYNLRNTLSYPKYNLYLTYSLKDSTGRVLSSELHEMTLFDPKTGEPRGDGLGDIFTHRIKALESYELPYAGPYSFTIKQYMRYDSLPEVVSVGLRIEQATTE